MSCLLLHTCFNCSICWCDMPTCLQASSNICVCVCVCVRESMCAFGVCKCMCVPSSNIYHRMWEREWKKTKQRKEERDVSDVLEGVRYESRYLALFRYQTHTRVCVRAHVCCGKVSMTLSPLSVYTPPSFVSVCLLTSCLTVPISPCPCWAAMSRQLSPSLPTSKSRSLPPALTNICSNAGPAHVCVSVQLSVCMCLYVCVVWVRMCVRVCV